MPNAAFKWVDFSVSLEENMQKLKSYISLFVLLEDNKSSPDQVLLVGRLLEGHPKAKCSYFVVLLVLPAPPDRFFSVRRASKGQMLVFCSTLGAAGSPDRFLKRLFEVRDAGKIM